MSALQSAETSLGIGQDDAVAQSLSNLTSAFGDLAAEPGGRVQRELVLSAAKQLGDTLRLTREQFASTRRDLDQQVSGVVADIQVRLDEIATLNHEIQQAEASGGNANDFLDRRALLAREVGERIGVATFTDKVGNLNLMLVGGGTLVEGSNSATLGTVANPANDGLLQPVLFSGSGAELNLDESCSGTLGGLLHVRDGQLRDRINDLDTLAFETAAQLNAVHQSGVGLDGLGGRNLFEPLGVTDGAAAILRLDAAVDGQPDALAAATDAMAIPGDNRCALLLAEALSSPFMSGGTQTPEAYWRSSVTSLGSALSGAERDFSLHADRISQLTQMRESVSGVSIDEEMIALTKAQTAFEAAAKVIQTGDELLETILSLT